MENHIVKQRETEMETLNEPKKLNYALETDQDSMLFVDPGGSSIGSGN